MIKGFTENGASIGEVRALTNARFTQRMAEEDLDMYDRYVHFGGKVLTPMSYVEQTVRLSQFLTLSEQGISASEIYRRIATANFDYNLKSRATRYLEYIIPFYNFQKLNLQYWLKVCADNPRVVAFIDDWMGITENSYDIEPYDLYETPYYQGARYHIENGNPIASWMPSGTSSGEAGLVLKFNPSYMDMLNFIIDPKNKLLGSVIVPIQPVLTGSLNFVGNLWNGNQLEGDEALDYVTNVAKATLTPDSLPVVGVIAQRYLNPNSTSKTSGKRLTKPLERTLGVYLPTLFGSTQRWENYKIDNTDLNDPHYYSSYTYRQKAMPERHANYYRQYYRRYYPRHSRAYWYAQRLLKVDARYRPHVMY